MLSYSKGHVKMFVFLSNACLYESDFKILDLTTSDDVTFI